MDERKEEERLKQASTHETASGIRIRIWQFANLVRQQGSRYVHALERQSDHMRREESAPNEPGGCRSAAATRAYVGVVHAEPRRRAAGET